MNFRKLTVWKVLIIAFQVKVVKTILTIVSFQDELMILLTKLMKRSLIQKINYVHVTMQIVYHLQIDKAAWSITRLSKGLYAFFYWQRIMIV